MQNDTVQNLINASFLSDGEKSTLLQYLNEHSADENFYEIFNSFLLKELQEKGEKCEKTLKAFDEKVLILDTGLKNKKGEALKKIEEQLAHIDPSNLTQKEKVWDEYYEEVEGFQGDYEKQLKESFSSLLIP